MWQNQKKGQERKMFYLQGEKRKYLTIKAEGSEPSMHLSRTIWWALMVLQNMASRKMKVVYQEGKQ